MLIQSFKNSLLSLHKPTLLLYPSIWLVSLISSLLTFEKSNPIIAFFILLYIFLVLILVVHSAYTIFTTLSNQEKTSSIKQSFFGILFSIAWIILLFITIYSSILILANFGQGANIYGIFTTFQYFRASETFIFLFSFLFVILIEFIFILNSFITLNKRFNGKKKYFLIPLFFLCMIIVIIIQIQLLPSTTQVQGELRNFATTFQEVNLLLSSTLPYFIMYATIVCCIAFAIAGILFRDKKTK